LREAATVHLELSRKYVRMPVKKDYQQMLSGSEAAFSRGFALPNGGPKIPDFEAAGSR
jgi:hypothetical protein